MKQLLTLFTLSLILLTGLNCGSSEDPDEKVDVVMMETGTLQGEVQSIDGVKIQVRLLKDGQLVAQTETDDSYEFAELEQGDYTIQISAKGYNTTELDVTVIPEDTVSLDKVTLDMLAEPVSHLRGVLTDMKTGDPLSDVLVQLSDNEGEEYEALTNNQGIFTFENLPVDQAFTLTVAHEGYEDYEVAVDKIAADKTFELDVELTAIPEPVILDPGQGLSVGSQAPVFQLPDSNENEQALTDYIPDKNVVVVFYRGGW